MAAQASAILEENVGPGHLGDARPPSRLAQVAATALAAMVVATAAAPAARPDAGEAAVPGVRTSASPGDATSYWTPERMDSATPADLLVGEGQAGAPANAEGGDLGLRNHPISFTRFELTDTTAFPPRVHGRVFFSIGLDNFSCSGTVITTPAGNAVLTAGHCVFDPPPPRGDGTGFVDNWAFVPGFRDPDGTGVGNDPEMPFGELDATLLLAPAGWTSAGSLASDFAGALLAPDPNGSPIERVIGARGIAFNQPRDQAYRAFGYPAKMADGFDGSRLYACDSRYGGETPVNTREPAPMGIGCDMTGGASGGAWVAKNRFVESVNSFVVGSHPDVIYGPRLEAEARALYGPAGLGGWRCRGLTPTIVGTPAGETIVGTRGRDIVFAHGGNDIVRAGAGRDVICGGKGGDVLRGGKGRDVVSGGPGRLDRCLGGPGRDRAAGGCERRRI